jgi:predicted Zn-dependent protease
MGNLDLTMGATERAAQLLGELVDFYPAHPNAHYAYGRALMQLGRPEEAEREFDIHMRLMAEKKPTSPMATRD